MRVTLNEQEQQYLIENYKRKTLEQIARDLNISSRKLRKNKELLIEDEPEEISFDNGGYFDVDKFQKYYAF